MLLNAKRFHEQGLDCADIPAGSLKRAFGFRRDRQGTAIGGFGELVEIAGKTGRSELRQHFS